MLEGTRTAGLLGLLLAAVGCGESGGPDGDPGDGDGDADGDTDVDADGDGDGDGDADGDADGDGDADPDAPIIRIHVLSSTAPVEHLDAWSGQTPRGYSSGYRKFSMLRDANDADPLVVFDHGDGFVEAGYGDGDDTVVGSAVARNLTAGHFTIGRVVMSHVRYTVDTTMHAQGSTVAGELDNVQVLSDGTSLDGETHDRGWYRYVFRAGGFEVPQEGMGAPLPTAVSAADIHAEVEDGETIFTFPIDVDVAPDVSTDVDMIFEMNHHECFRWEEQDTAGYADGVFDTEPAAYEPVRQFGSNSFAVRMEVADDR